MLASEAQHRSKKASFMLSPPVIIIDITSNPNVADRTNVVIHEYQHHINHQLWIGARVKPPEEPNQDDTQAFLDYLDDENERIAHRTQFMYMLGTGMSKEEVLRGQIGGRAKLANMPIAKKYMEIINEAASMLQEELTERDISHGVERMMVDETEDEALFNPDDMGGSYFG